MELDRPDPRGVVTRRGGTAALCRRQLGPGRIGGADRARRAHLERRVRVSARYAIATAWSHAAAKSCGAQSCRAMD